MRFAITGADRYLGVFEAFVRAGWQPVKLFTVPLGPLDRETSHAMVGYAADHGAAVQISRMTQRDMEDLKAQECDVLIVASYRWRIDDWTPYLKYAVNFHASPLPEARGPYPAVRAILEQRASWAITCHKVVDKFDRGDILAAQHFAMQPDETHESLDLKIQIAARRLATAVAGDFQALWHDATPQGAGSFWPLWKEIDRALDFQRTVSALMRQVRAFGRLDTLAFVSGRWLTIRRAVGWEEGSGPPPGTVAHVNGRTIVVAAADGYVGLLEWEFADDETLARLTRIT